MLTKLIETVAGSFYKKEQVGDARFALSSEEEALVDQFLKTSRAFFDFQD